MFISCLINIVLLSREKEQRGRLGEYVWKRQFCYVKTRLKVF